MSLIKLQLDGNNKVVDSGWANPDQRKAGDVTSDGFTVYEVPEAEYQACVVDNTTYQSGHLVVDPNYQPPVIDTTPTPSAQDQINAQLTLQIAANKTAQDKINAQLLLASATNQIGGNE